MDVPEGSADAKKWPLWKPPDYETATPTNDSGMPKPSTSDPPLASSSSLATTSDSTTKISQPPTTKQQQQQPARPGRRKPKLQLVDVPSAAASRKGLKRLTTLEKSALDWKAHVDAASGERESERERGRGRGRTEPAELAAELEANRRGGGYLEKVEFLQRVDDRKDQALEANLDHKRRRGR